MPQRARRRAAVQAPKKSTLLAQQIFDEVISQGMQPGDRLDTEAEMVERYGVGRSTIREALRLLESQGVLTIKTGPGGGPVISQIDAGYLAANLALLLESAGATFGDVMQARLVLEPPIAAAAAEERDPSFVEALRASTHMTDDIAGNGDAVVSQAAGFHDLVAATAANPLLEYLLRALHRITVPFAGQLDYANAPKHEVIHCHEEIVAAIDAGDAEAASAAMRRDLLSFMDFAESEGFGLLDQPVRWSETNGA